MRCLSQLTRSLTRPLPFWSWLALPGLTCALVACGADSLKPDVRAQPSGVYWSLTLNHHAATLGPRAQYDTATLVATPRNAAGDALAGLPAPTYLSRDVTKVTVTPDGLVRVSGSGFEPVWVVATLVADNVRHVDSVRVRSVDVDPPPVLTTFSIQPVPPDSAKRAIGSDLGFGQFPPLQARATDASGNPLTDLMVSFQSLDPVVSGIDELSGLMHPVALGEVSYTASTMMFGVAKADTVRSRTGWPINVFAAGVRAALSDTLVTRVGAGGLVTFSADIDGDNAIDFDSADLPNIREPSASAAYGPMGFSFFCNGPLPLFQRDCNSGNVVAFVKNAAMRAFLAPGTYYYHFRPSGAVGRIEVLDER